MKTKVAAIYGKRDVRLREFELPEITDNELLVSVISDSVCLSTWKAALLGSEHKRVPDDLENHPVITGHECAGVIVEVGKNLTGKYKKGQRFVLQPAMGLPSGYSAGYSYEYFGGNATYMIIPEIAINLGCVLPYHGSYFAAASLAEPMCCIIVLIMPIITPRNMFMSIAWASNLAAILHCWRVRVRWALALSITPLTVAYNRHGWWWSISTTNAWRRCRSCCRWIWRPVKALSWCM
ncbi:alcohol dehydrogenase catalytic domain-containing protein [Pseudomonas aeruginosa]|nr:alcohol dehydrogenase catalytic domain-containing protein [Pseudomonas aeruginosa]